MGRRPAPAQRRLLAGRRPGARLLDLSGAVSRVRLSRARSFRYVFRAPPGRRGRVLIRTRRKARVPGARPAGRAHLVIAKRSFRSPASGVVRLRIRVSREHGALLRRNRRLLLSVGVIVADSQGPILEAARRLTLLPPR